LTMVETDLTHQNLWLKTDDNLTLEIKQKMKKQLLCFC